MLLGCCWDSSSVIGSGASGGMNKLHLSLTEIAFQLREEGKEEEAVWILRMVKWERARPKGTRKVKAQLKGTDKTGIFYIDHEKLG